MLQSVVTALAGPDLYSRRDAYSALTNCLRTYKDFPDFDHIVIRLPSMQQYLVRDLAAPRDLHKLPEQALNCAFLLLGRFPQAMSLDFRKTIIESNIAMLKEKAETKEVAKLQLNMLTLRELYGKAMTPERAKEILKGVTYIDKWISGSSVVGLRMIIYRQMIQHHPNVFIEGVQSCLTHIFHGLMSSTKELRLRAMETGMVLGQLVGTRQRVSKALEALMETKSDKDLRYAEFMQNQLLRMFDRAYDVEHVPQLWGVIMLMLRGTPSFIGKWLQSKDWCLIIQKCFNKSDEKVNRYAWNAWNYTIFATGSRLVEHESICKRLIQPVIGHLQRPWDGEDVDTVRQAARSTLILLLYFAFGQPSTDASLVACWNRLVRDVCHKILEKCPLERAFLVDTLARLVSGPGLKIWRPERALDVGRSPMTPDDIPHLDPQWQRRNISVILETLSVLGPVQDTIGTADIEGTAYALWQCLMSSMAMAGEKEIQMSLDLKKAIAAMLNFLAGLSVCTEKSLSSEATDPLPLKNLAPFMCAAVEQLGPDCFTSKIVRRNEHGTFEVPLTPSKHRQISSAHLEAPMISMVRILARCLPAGEADRSVASPASSVIQPFLAIRGGAEPLLCLLTECIPSLSSSASIDTQTSSAYLWQAIAEVATTALQQETHTTRRRSTASPGQVYLNVVHILGFGLKMSDMKSWHCFTALYNTTCRCLKEDAGDAGYLLALTGPLVQKTSDLDPLKATTLLRLTNHTLNEGIPAPDDKGLAQAAKALGEHFISAISGGPLEWLSGLCGLLCKAWITSYEELATVDHASLHSFLQVFASLYDALPRLEPRMGAAWALPLIEVQEGLCMWLDDKDEKIATYSSHGYDLKAAMSTIWSRHLTVVCKKQFRDHHHDSFEAYLITGLRSHRMAVANQTITAWNALVNEAPEIDVSQRLSGLLRQLARFTDVRLPDAAKATASATGNVTTTPNSDGGLFPWLRSSNSEISQGLTAQKFLPSAHAHSRPYVFKGPTSSATSTPSKTRTRPSTTRKAPPPRLRHDDSQIQFVAVTSSPMQPDEQESQFLTAHQEETRERQQVDAAMFADLRSSSPMSPRSPAHAALVQHPEAVRRPLTAGFDGSDDDVGYSVFRRKPVAPPGPKQVKGSEDHDKTFDSSNLVEEFVKLTQKGTDNHGPKQIHQKDTSSAIRAKSSEKQDAADEKGSSSDTVVKVTHGLGEVGEFETTHIQSEMQPEVIKSAAEARAVDDGDEDANTKTAPDAHEKSDAAREIFHDAASSPEGTDNDAPIVESSLPGQTGPNMGTLQTPAQQLPTQNRLTKDAPDEARTSRIEDSFDRGKHIGKPQVDSSSPLGGQVNVAWSNDMTYKTGMHKEASNAPQIEQVADETPSREDGKVVRTANDNGARAVAAPEEDPKTSSAVSASQQTLDEEENGECITVQEPDASTPPLTDLLKARGVLKDQPSSQSPLMQKRGRGRPTRSSIKRSFSAVGGEELTSNASSQQTPSQAREERAKRRKTESQLSETQLSASQTPSQARGERTKRRTTGSQLAESQVSASQTLTPQTTSKREGNSRSPQRSQPSPSLKRKREATDAGEDEDVEVSSQSQAVKKPQEPGQAAAASSPQIMHEDQPRGLMARLRSMIKEVKKVWFNPEEEEEASELAYKLQREIVKAGRRFGK